jgi:hypothetical protein
MTASSSTRCAREPLDRCDAAAGHQPVVVSRARRSASRSTSSAQQTSPGDGGIDRRKKQRPRLTCQMALRRHSLVA